MEVVINKSQDLEWQVNKYILSCIIWHVVEDNIEYFKKLAKDIIDNYQIEDIEGGIIAWKWLDKETIYIFESKDYLEPIGSWAFKILKAIENVPKREKAKYIKTDTTSERVKDYLIKRGFNNIVEKEHKPVKFWELIKEVG